MNFFQDLISDKEGHASSKRSMAALSFLFILYAAVMNLTKGVHLDDNLLNFFMITILGLSGASTVENMATKPNKASTITTVKQTTEEIKP